jgi:hypothetical protein
MVIKVREILFFIAWRGAALYTCLYRLYATYVNSTIAMAVGAYLAELSLSEIIYLPLSV